MYNPINRTYNNMDPQKLHADRYKNANSTILRNDSPENVRQRVVLPSSLTGSDRFMQRVINRLQDDCSTL